MDNFLYASISDPPGVLELMINDVVPRVTKVYSLLNSNQRYIGLSTMAVNLDFIVHAMLDTVT
jgi:hypothetical protein